MFTQRSLDFLYFNHKYNSSEWYNEHKQDYIDYLLTPFKQLVEALTPAMLSIDPQFITEPKVDRAISRLYKDMRFSKDGYKYRENMWCLFIRDKKLYNGLPGYYFDLSPYSFSYGCGYYQADGESIKNFRTLVAEDSKEFRAARKCLQNQNYFSLYGNEIQLPKKYAALPDSSKKWLSLDNLGVSAECKDADLLFSDALPEFLAERFKDIIPFYQLLLKAENMKNQ